jgi:hypothetical protein
MRDRASEVIKEARNHVNQILEVKPGNKPIRFVCGGLGFLLRLIILALGYPSLMWRLS